MIYLDIITSLFYFLLFIAVMVWIVRRSLPKLEAADDAERRNYKQLVGHRANLKKELDKEHLQTNRQKFTQEYLLLTLERWKKAVQEEQRKKEEAREITYQFLVRKEEEKMAIIAREQLKKKLLPEIFERVQEQFVQEFREHVSAETAYIDHAIQSIKKRE